jgi:putative flippase GtrA
MAARFVTVGASGYAVNVATFTLIVHATPGPVGIAKITAEALATMAILPLGFTANRLRALAPEPRNHVCPLGSTDESR